jgi:hypothetical protein
VGAQRIPRAGPLHGTAAEGKDGVLAGQQVDDGPLLEVPEGRLAVLGEDLPDGASPTTLDDQVAVDEGQSQALREHVADRRLAGAHEAHEDDHRPKTT